MERSIAILGSATCSKAVLVDSLDTAPSSVVLSHSICMTCDQSSVHWKRQQLHPSQRHYESPARQLSRRKHQPTVPHVLHQPPPQVAKFVPFIRKLESTLCPLYRPDRIIGITISIHDPLVTQYALMRCRFQQSVQPALRMFRNAPSVGAQWLRDARQGRPDHSCVLFVRANKSQTRLRLRNRPTFPNASGK
jgi:hypothetical protein